MVSKWPLQISGPAEGLSDLRVGCGSGGFGTSPDREPADGLFQGLFKKNFIYISVIITAY